MEKISKVVFVLTAKCLHRCTYCFDRANYPLKTIDYTAEDIKAFFDLNKEYLEDEIEIFLQGGDLFLAKNLDSILETLYFYPHKFRFIFLLSTLPIEMFTRYPFLNTANVGISIDGPRHVHNLNRKRIDGKSSFDEVEYLLHMKHLPNISFQSVIASNTVQFIEETEQFFRDLKVDHSYAIDRRAPYWTKESLELLRNLPVPAWGSGSYERFTFSDIGFTNYFKKYIVFADGSVHLFGNEFMPAHELKYFCNITERTPLAPLYNRAIEGLTLCKHPCSKCTSHCSKYSVVNDVTAGHTHQYVPGGNTNDIRQFWLDRMGLLDPDTKQETTLEKRFFNSIPFDRDIPNQLSKEEE